MERSAQQPVGPCQATRIRNRQARVGMSIKEMCVFSEYSLCDANDLTLYLKL